MSFSHLTPLYWAVALAGVWAAAALLLLYRNTQAFGKRKLFSEAAGNAMDGVKYAFTKGMSPTAKESVMMALPSYAAGMLYHTGVFTAFFLLSLKFIGFKLISPLHEAASLLAGLGALCGLALLVKRLVKPAMRAISSPDDYISNMLATAFALLACLNGFLPTLESVWLIESAAMLVYLPLGKIRHCLFFFSTRYHFGAFFGRRGTYPV